MNKNLIKGVCIGFSIIILLTAGMYLGLSLYYIGEFSYNTWINGVYCTGKSVEEVNEELRKDYQYDYLTIWDREENSYLIQAEDIHYKFDFKISLDAYMQKQNPYLWIDNLREENREKHILPVIRYDAEAFKKAVYSLPFMYETRALQDRVVEIRKTDDGYILINERENVLDRDKAMEVINLALDQFEPEVDLVLAGCYEDLPLDDVMKQNIALWPKIRDFQNCGIIYQMGDEQIPINAGITCNWILLEEDGSFVLDEWGDPILDETKIADFVDELADAYDTVGGIREFHATRGEIVTVKGGIYGNKINRGAEIEYLKEAFTGKRSEIHTPEYTQMAWEQGKDDIGDTYIEVDMTNQMLYYYVKGELIIETPVVTGNTSLRRGTPTGVNFVYAKQRNRILRGEDYASPVKFWIPVKGAIGIHDASWRSKYGGEIYKTNGSHGCINTPYDAVSQLYELVEVGTPCVMFY